MSGRVNDVTPLNALARENEHLRERIAELESTLREAGTAIERATFDAHDRDWSRQLMARIRFVLTGDGGE